jgi:predicted metal-binding membrane protein
MPHEAPAKNHSAWGFNASRAVVLTGIVALSALSWVYMLVLGRHASAAALTMDVTQPDAFAGFLFAFLMWSVMMVAMMLPSATPTVLMFETMVRKGASHASRTAMLTIFVAGYLAIWTLYSGLAAAGQLWLQHSGLVVPAISKSLPAVSAGLLIVAGIFQLTPLKHACLRHCQSPLGFFMVHWRRGRKGALLMGLRSGVYCVGCCWALMVLMFVAGVMNVIWMAALAIFVLFEKLAPGGRRFSQLSGLLMIAWGVWIAIRL